MAPGRLGPGRISPGPDRPRIGSATGRSRGPQPGDTLPARHRKTSERRGH